MTGDGRLDLAQLHTEAADLHLVVGAAQVLQLAIGRPPHHITGPVHPRTVTTERIRHEPRGRERRTAAVATRQTGPGEIELSPDTRGHRSQPGIEDVHASVADRAADRRCGRNRAVTGEPAGGVDRRLGGSVEVGDPGVRHGAADPVHQAGRQRLARQDHQSGAHRRAGVREQLVEGGRHRAHQ